jgi:heavy metal sensor kinase
VTLTNRLSLFFVGTLALVLILFSTALYVLARIHLHRQTEERLEAALNTLVAAAEVGPGGVDWEPHERQLALGPAALGAQVVWQVCDDQGRVVDQAPQADGQQNWQDERWLVQQRRLQPGSPNRPAAAGAPAPEPRQYPALVITAAIPLGPVQAALRQLAGVLSGLSLATWLAALAVGRAVCRRALQPVQRMARAAREMDAADAGQRLPIVATGDELEDLTRAFNGLLDRLHEAFERQRRFTGDASHQLRTPLTALIGQIEVALRRERGAADYREVLTAVQRQALHLRRIVEALLFLARANAEARLPDREPIVLEAWLETHLRGWSGHAGAADLRMERESDTPLPVEVQPALLGELLDILLENACKYSPPGAPIVIHLGRAGAWASLTVEDRGCGICAGDLAHVFEPFFRSAEARRLRIAGVGLGLAIARRLAAAFGGRLLVESQEGQGSRFTLELPLREHAESPPPQPVAVPLQA